MKIKSILSLMFFLVSSVGSAQEQQQSIPKLYTIGDSTMANNDDAIKGISDSPFRGWGHVLPDYFDRSKINVINASASGRSSKSFIGEGRWDKVINDLNKGDYLVIQFGHNDSKPDEMRNTDPETTYKENLIRYISEAQAKGVTPILATSIVRRHFEEDGSLRETHGRYIGATKEVAEDMQITCINLNKLTQKLVLEYGPEDSKQFFMWVEPDVYKSLPDGRTDNTHLNIKGANEVASMFVNELKRINHPLVEYLK